jgi:hypothetical protein
MTRREAIERYHALRNGPILEMAAMSPDEILGPLLTPLTVADAMEVPEVRALVSWMRRHEECRCSSCIDPLLAPFPPTPDDEEVES